MVAIDFATIFYTYKKIEVFNQKPRNDIQVCTYLSLNHTTPLDSHCT